MVDTSDLEGLNPFDILDTECIRISDFLDTLDEAGWTRDTRNEGWRIRELVSHFDGVETYHLACLNDQVQQWIDSFKARGAKDGNDFNGLQVEDRAGLPVEAVVASWREANAEVRRRLRDLGPQASMSSSVGSYPVDLMTFHICSEYATHSDDMAVPVDQAEQKERTAWREKVSLFALKEAEKPVEIQRKDGSYIIKAEGKQATLGPADFVEAVTARLKTIDTDLQEALRALA